MSRYTRAQLEDMTAKNQVSMLEGLDLKNAEEVRKFMKGLEYHLTHIVLNANYETVIGLTEFQVAKITHIVSCIRNNGSTYPLLAEAALRFVAARHLDPKSVLIAGWHFDEFASESALTMPDMYPLEYEQAEACMIDLRGTVDIFRLRDRLHELIPGAFVSQVYHTGRAVELEKLAAKRGGDIRNIPKEHQLAPHPIPTGNSAINPEYCYQCTKDGRYCNQIEPKCSSCRERWLPCSYEKPVLKEDKKKEAKKKVEKQAENEVDDEAGDVEGNENCQFDEDIHSDENIEFDEGIDSLESYEDIEDYEVLEDQDNKSAVSSIHSSLTVDQIDKVTACSTSKPSENFDARTVVVSKDSAEEVVIEKPAVAKPTIPKTILKLTIGKKLIAEDAAADNTGTQKTSFKKAAVDKATKKKVTIDERAPIKIITAEKVTIDDSKAESSATIKLAAPKSKGLKTESTTVTANGAKSKADPTASAPKESVAPKAAKTLPPTSDRVTRRMARSNVLNTGDIDPGSASPFKNENNYASTTIASKPQGSKRKQQTTDNDDDGNIASVNPRSSKRAKLPVIKKSLFAAKRSSDDAEIDDDYVLQRSKKTKIIFKAPSSTKSDGEGEKRAARGRPEQDHEGKKCCNTCQGWKPLSDFAIKKHSKTPGATVGYCKRCQANKQAKNKAKADAKKGTGPIKAATSAAVDDENDDDLNASTEK